MSEHDDRGRDEQDLRRAMTAPEIFAKLRERPDPTARETAADELAEAEHAFRIAVPDSFGVDAVPDWAVRLYMAEYDERGRERDAARAELERLRRLLKEGR